MNSNHRLPVFVPFAILGAVFFVACAEAEDFAGVRYLDNGVIKIGVDLDIGGAITYLSQADGGENLVNSHDWGRQIQMSFYSGPIPFMPRGKMPRHVWRHLGWNPIQSGDCFENQSEVIAFTKSATSLYVKCIPMQWPLDNEPGECTFETWISLEGKTAQVRSKLNNHREDKTQYAGRSQELPAVYTNGSYYRLFTYRGNAPYTGDTLHQVTKVWDTSQGVEVEGGPWDRWYATENWAALVNDENQGVGIWSPGTFSFSGGFAGVPGKGGPQDSPTGYISPLRREILDHNIEYSYDYVLIVGSLEEIRSHVVAHAKGEQLPHSVFSGDRQGWMLKDCEDTGWPVENEWRVRLSGKTSMLLGPNAFWDAAHMPTLYLRAAFDTGKDQAVVRFERFGKEGKERFGKVRFDIISDGKMHDYAIDLAASEAYRGHCVGLALLPLTDGGGNRSVAVEYISYLRGELAER